MKNIISLGILIAIVLLVAAISTIVILQSPAKEYNAQSPEKQTNLAVDISPSLDQQMNKDSEKTTVERTSQQQNIIVTPKKYNIDIKNYAFSPPEIRIKKGDTITWTNSDSVQHTVTSDSGNELDSEMLSKGESFSYKFDEVGTFDYHCAPHLSMKAKVIVE